MTEGICTAAADIKPAGQRHIAAMKTPRTPTLLQSSTILFTLIVMAAVLWQLAIAQRTPASTSAAPSKLSPSLKGAAENPAASNQLVTVRLLLTRTSLLKELPTSAAKLLTTTKGTTAARLAAQRVPAKKNAAEEVAASIAEASRNKAIPLINEAARGGVLQSARLQRQVARLGGRIISASPLPNQIVARVPAAALVPLAKNPEVANIAPAALPQPMNAPIDGSPVWQANGFTGQGSSADGKGSPDVVVFDLGIRTTHDAFKSRLPGDCSTCNATGPSRITSPVVRSDFSGDKHANTIAAEIAATSLDHPGTTGMAYGIDKLYDNFEAYNPYLWDLGITTPRPLQFPTNMPASDPGLGGGNDLPEVINYSAGIYEDTVDYDPNWSLYFDALESRFGILNTVSTGNCGHANNGYDGCLTAAHRVSNPSTAFNVLSVAGLQTSTTYPDTSGFAPWSENAPGPTWGGRKKPDLIAYPGGTAGTPSAIDDHAYAGGMLPGTSFAAPVAASGALLLASAGVYLPTAQKAIMINTTTPVQGQTYWTPLSGWGALNLESAFYQRGNYVNSSVTGAGPNSARFFSVSSSNAGDRTTLVWNRRTDVDSVSSPTNSQILGPTYYNLTDLDLSQISPSDPSGLTVTSTGGSDAADTVDTDQVVSAANPMPGNGTDGGDNVEQIRSTAAGSQIIKVKAKSAVDGAASEPFSLASADPISALATPIPNVSVSPNVSVAGLSQSVTVTATISNPSADLPLSGASATLDLPSGTSLQSGANPRPLATLAPSSSTIITWTVQGTTSGSKAFTVETSGTAYGETFAGNGSASVTVDGTPPEVTLTPAPTYSTTANPAFSWSATDTDATVATYDIDTAIGSGPWTTLLSGTTSTNVTAGADEGEVLHLRVRATDTLGNTSDWGETATTVDADPPTITFGSPASPAHGTLHVPVTYGNVGAPITAALYNFSHAGSTPDQSLVGATPAIINYGRQPFVATLTISLTDGAGRVITRAAQFTIPSRYVNASLKLQRPRVKRRRASFTGSLNRNASRWVTLLIQRTGRKGTRRVTRRLTLRSGRYKAEVRLKPGNYRASVSYPGDGHVLSDVSARRFSVR